MLEIFSYSLILLYGILFGITMKIADLLDEHGLKWFKGSTILFGFLWGGFGILLILSNQVIANIYLAIVLAFVLRYRIDYLNHGIAATMMVLSFFAIQIIDWTVFIIFFSVFAIFGLIRDALKEEKSKRHSPNFFRKLLNLRSQYYVLPLFYSIVTGFWLVFWVVGLNMLAYELTLRYWKNKGIS